MRMDKTKRGQQKEIMKWVGKSIKAAKKIRQEAMKAKRDVIHRPYCLHPGSKALCEIKCIKVNQIINQKIISKIGEGNSPGDNSKSEASNKCIKSTTGSY